jgi:hypothetical protein
MMTRAAPAEDSMAKKRKKTAKRDPGRRLLGHAHTEARLRGRPSERDLGEHMRMPKHLSPLDDRRESALSSLCRGRR